MLKVGRAQFPRHSAVARMDGAGNRIVDCRCGWSGNALGWADHLDSVVRQALGAGSAAEIDRSTPWQEAARNGLALGNGLQVVEPAVARDVVATSSPERPWPHPDCRHRRRW